MYETQNHLLNDQSHLLNEKDARIVILKKVNMATGIFKLENAQVHFRTDTLTRTNYQS